MFLKGSRLVHTVLAYQAISNSGTGLSWFLITGQLHQAGIYHQFHLGGFVVRLIHVLDANKVFGTIPGFHLRLADL